jgi:hypothetical protein
MATNQTKPAAPPDINPDPHSNNPRHHTQRLPLPPRSYKPFSSFRSLKKRILSNAYAYYAHRFPQADRFDLITASRTPGNLASTNWRAALIVYPDPKKRGWQMLYKSNRCPTVEDAAFEVMYWVEEDMWGVLEKMEERGGRVGTKQEGNSTGGGDKSQAKNDCKEQEGTENNEIKDSTTEKTTVIQKGESCAQTESRTSGLKRKSRAEDSDERKKSVKISEDERVFVGNSKLKELMGDDDAAVYISLFGDAVVDGE